MNNRRSRPGLRLPFHKTNVYQQTSYIFHTVTGDITLTPLPDGRVEVTNTCTEADSRSFVLDADGLTLEMLQELHRADNREVMSNLRHAKAPVSDREQQDIDAWRNDPDHPERLDERQFPDGFLRWNIPLDSRFDGKDGTSAFDRDPVMLQAWENAQPEEDEARDRVREYVGSLPPRQQQVYRLHIIEERTLREAAGIMGITPQRASAILKQLKKNLLSQFHRKPP